MSEQPTVLVVVQGDVRGLLQHGRPAVDHMHPAVVLQLLGASHQGLDEVLIQVGPDHPRLRNRTDGLSEKKEEEGETDSLREPPRTGTAALTHPEKRYSFMFEMVQSSHVKFILVQPFITCRASQAVLYDTLSHNSP